MKIIALEYNSLKNLLQLEEKKKLRYTPIS